MNDITKDVWIGLANVVPCEGNGELGNAKGAYVKVFALASSPSEFKEKIAAAFLTMDFELKDVEEIETFTSFDHKYSASQDFHELAEQAQSDNNVVFDTFHVYEHDETVN